ncbi:hypothetical protein JCM3775_005607 [Rhodotorula graminis]|uniref:Uncharacterized protein n=1 Tax=Rhodotorula graminis (strain WP1) TaxID=578459 RepID=A0A194SAS2_RHOGW|nr:uncharacterized protein RHOBADRAFT_51507 [Rhodotorula graminis WP1]KPV77689.1 hypothetical protein RHOBADRAFT_51507 [Rhodotorula graminis WP1]
MDNFSRADRIRAVCAPLCCCFPRRLALSPSSESLNPDSARDWYAQTRPSVSPSASSGLPRTWQEYEARDARREADLLSLHEGIGGGDFSAAASRRRTARGRGGDISGGGADEGSGLTRWTLFKSWWRGGGGEIRLDDSDDERDEPGAQHGDGQRREAAARLDPDDIVDTAALGLEDVALPPAPPTGAALAPPSPVPALAPPGTLAPSSASDSAISGGGDDDRQARRARRQARRRARELGISVDEFEAGASAEPAELPASPFLDVHTGVRRGSKSDRSLASSASSGSRSRRHETGDAALFAIGEEGDGVDEAIFGQHVRRSRREGTSRTSHRSADSGSQEGSSRRRRHRDGATSSTFHPSLERDDAHAHLVPLPLSPRADSHGPSSSHGSSSRPSRHRSNPSTSTLSTEASSRVSRRTKRREHAVATEPAQEDAYLSPLHDPVDDDDGARYYEGEDGQLYACGSEHEQEQEHGDVLEEQAQAPVDYAAALSPGLASWDHIGVLPGVKTASLAAGSAAHDDEDEEERGDGW